MKKRIEILIIFFFVIAGFICIIYINNKYKNYYPDIKHSSSMIKKENKLSHIPSFKTLNFNYPKKMIREYSLSSDNIKYQVLI